MTRAHRTLWTVLGLSLLLLPNLSVASFAESDDEIEIRTARIHKIAIDCEEGSEEACQRILRIEDHGDGTHALHLGDHEMTWIAADAGDAHHYAFVAGFHGEGGFLGIQLTDLTPELRQHFGVAADEGVMVAKVVEDSAAFRAGLAAGDIITRIDGESVRSARDLTHAVRSREEGDTVTLEIWRQGAVETLTATLDESRSMARRVHRVEIDCEDGGDDCHTVILGGGHGGLDIDCPDGEQCEVQIDCRDGDCDCAVDGESVDCQDLHTVHHHGD